MSRAACRWCFVAVGDQLAAAIDRDAALVEAEAGSSGGIFIESAEDYAGSAGSHERFLRFVTETDQVHEAGHEAFAHASDVASAQFEAAAGGDGGGIVGEALGVGAVGLGLGLGFFVGALDAVDVGLLGGGESGFGTFVGCGGLRADEAFGPVFVEFGVHLVLAVETLEGLGFVGGVGFGVVL
ncbi:MAG: hypothetical protein QOJ42_3900 [Acidobacteriaceae bacterium]|nr:hypothetical protein [Acidobacteriaceae bacterium]